MQWYEIEVSLPLHLYTSTYNFLWLYADGLRAEKTDNGFIIKAYLFSYFPHKFLNRLNNFLKIQAKSFQVNYSPPVVNSVVLSFPKEFVIVPIPTSCIPPFGLPILLQRGGAFGTGNHPCTIYCLQALKDIFKGESGGVQKKQILDAGTGTGILAIAAAKLGARDITGAEIDHISIKEAQENVRLNNITHEIQILPCSVTEIKGQFNFVFANLYGTLLINIASSLAQQLSPKGWLILGGMNVPHDEVVISAFSQHNLKEYIRYRDQEWCVAVLRKG
jgi:ribosomal protein L11 methylase PrmA